MFKTEFTAYTYIWLEYQYSKTKTNYRLNVVQQRTGSKIILPIRFLLEIAMILFTESSLQ